jgi:hypothetical protein
LDWIDASIPHPEGKIGFRYRKDEGYEITLPAGITGTLIVDGTEAQPI